MEYDVQEIRRAAGQVESAANTLSDILSGDLSRIRGEIPTKLRGEAADALVDVITDIEYDTRTLTSGLEQVYKALYLYAQKLVEADEEVKRIIEGT